MGVDYTAILAVGKEFENESEAQDFLESYNLLSEEDLEAIEDCCLSECLPCNMDGGGLNMYSGYGYYIGYYIRCHDPETFQKDYIEALTNWDKAFGGKEKAEIIHTVRVH